MALFRPHEVMKMGCCLPVGSCSCLTYPPPSPTMDMDTGHFHSNHYGRPHEVMKMGC